MDDHLTGIRLREVTPWSWEIPRQGRMRVPGLVFGSASLVERAGHEQALEQVANVACLPGIERASMAMPDIHWGYGFAIGGVAAFNLEEGVISPGGVGYDIACGVRLVRSDLDASDLGDMWPRLTHELSRSIPSGVGRGGEVRLKRRDMDSLLLKGALWAIENGYGWQEDLEVIEDGGCLEGADPSLVSDRARQRGMGQTGSLGAGNHFIELQAVEEVFDREAADVFGVFEGQLCLMVHSGSRGLGHQVCSEQVRLMGAAAARAGIELPDRQLACAPIDSPEGRSYFAAMSAAVNFARANRQVLTHLSRRSFEQVLGSPATELGLRLVYDVSHNVAKFEEHELDGRRVRLCVHRKGATRSFPAGHPEVPARYRCVGQPVIVPGDMGTGSYLLKGSVEAMKVSFGSTCHGAGRVMGRRAARRAIDGHQLKERLEAAGITVRAGRAAALAEEAPEAYKDIDEVVDACHMAGLSYKVARLRPLGVVKG
jgi:tRNA-splicing ligase RtcB